PFLAVLDTADPDAEEPVADGAELAAHVGRDLAFMLGGGAPVTVEELRSRPADEWMSHLAQPLAAAGVPEVPESELEARWRVLDLADEERRDLLQQARRAVYGEAGPELQAREWTGPRPLSYQQQQLWFLDRLAPGRSTYNVPAPFRVRGRLDRVAFERALRA